MAEEIVFLGRDNTNDFQFKAENSQGTLVAWPLDEIVDDGYGENIGMNATEMRAIFNVGLDSEVTITSTDSDAGAITWAKAGYDVGEIRFDFTAVQEANLVSGLYELTMVVYDADNTDGIIWNKEGFPIRVKSV